MSVLNFRDETDNLFDNFLGRREQETGLTNYFPHTDIEEDVEKFTLRMDLPGLDKKDVKITFEQNMLSVSGKRNIEREDKGRNYHRVERVSGNFSRSFSLPPTVRAADIDANYTNGVLEIVLPKVEEARPKEIQVKIK